MAVVYQCICAFFFFLAFASFWGIVVDSIPAEIMGSSAGTINFGGQMAGVITPIVMGYLIDLQGGSFTGAFMFPVLGAVAAVVVAATISNKSATMSVSRQA